MVSEIPAMLLIQIICLLRAGRRPDSAKQSVIPQHNWKHSFPSSFPCIFDLHFEVAFYFPPQLCKHCFLPCVLITAI